MLGQRLFSAAIIISAMLILVWLDYQLGTDARLGRPGLLLAAFALILACTASVELIRMWSTEARPLNTTLAAIATTTMTGVCCIPLLWSDYPADCPIGKFGWAVSGIVIAIVMVFFHEMFWFDRNPSDVEKKPGIVTDRLARYVLCFGYLFMLFGFLAAHRTVYDSNAIGLLSIIMLMATVKMSDSFAYFFGKTFGKNKIAPTLSPKKTLEGAIGSVFGAWLASAIVLFLVAPFIFEVEIEKPNWWFLVYGLLISLAGMAGDLAESLFKRDANCKDSSKWLPGLGGILDVMDSLVFATPVSYFLWI